MLGKIHPVKQPISDGWETPQSIQGYPLDVVDQEWGITRGGGLWDASFGGFFGPQKN